MTRLHSVSITWLKGPLLRAGAVIGAGIAGSLEGIVLRQILGWNHVVPDWGADFDALVQIGMVALLALGVAMLWGAARSAVVTRSTRVLGGGILIGAGAFMLAEGILLHHVLKLHHVRPGPTAEAWDIGYLAAAACLTLVGWLMTRRRT